MPPTSSRRSTTSEHSSDLRREQTRTMTERKAVTRAEMADDEVAAMLAEGLIGCRPAACQVAQSITRRLIAVEELFEEIDRVLVSREVDAGPEDEPFEEPVGDAFCVLPALPFRQDCGFEDEVHVHV